MDENMKLVSGCIRIQYFAYLPTLKLKFPNQNLILLKNIFLSLIIYVSLKTMFFSLYL